jgi:hypothetical protein
MRECGHFRSNSSGHGDSKVVICGVRSRPQGRLILFDPFALLTLQSAERIELKGIRYEPAINAPSHVIDLDDHLVNFLIAHFRSPFVFVKSVITKTAYRFACRPSRTELAARIAGHDLSQHHCHRL